MEAPRLDKSRDHGQIHPPYNGAMYSQDGCYFSGSGEFLFREGQTAANAGQAAGASAPATPAPVEATPKAEGEDTGLDLKGWARGEVNIPFFNVKKAAAAIVPGIDTQNTKTIIAGLVDASVISADDAKR